MKIAHKMAGLVLSALAGILLLVGIGRYETGRVYESANYANVNTVPSVLLLGETLAAVGLLRTALWQHLGANTDEQRLRFEQKMTENHNQILENLKKFEPFVSDDKDRALLEADRAALAGYDAVREQTLALDRQGKNKEARDFMLSNQGPALKVWDAFIAHRDYNVELGRKTAQEAVAAKNLSSLVAVLSALITLLLVGGLGYAITRNIVQQLNEAVHAANRLAEGDLSTKIDASSDDEIGQLLKAMKNMIAKLSEVVTEITTGALAISSASEEVSATAQSLSQSSSEQAAGVEETSSSIEQMTSSIAQNTENAKVTDGMATKAAQEANEGGEAVRATAAAMNQIAKKISIIDDIAYQTNLLALNAAIEAARAGQHGKGFAVVAAEVRKLAERSQVAAQEIGEVAASSVELAKKAGTLLDQMVPSIQKTSDLVQEIAAGSQEQSQGVAQINTAVSQMNQTSQQNAASSEELAATAEELSGQAEQLQQTIGFFRLDSAVNVPSQVKRQVKKPAAARAAKKHHVGNGSVALALSAVSEPPEASFTKF